MDIILIPGLWLDADSWRDVAPTIADAGHTVRPLTMPGVGAPASESSDIGIADWVAAVVDEIDASAGPVVLVGHSGGGNVAWGAADARPDRVARVVLVDTVPPPPGGRISEFELVDGVIPFPGWDFFDEPDVADIDGPTREREAARASSVPAKVPTDPLALRDDRRLGVPVTMLSGGMDGPAFEEVIADWGPYAAEWQAIADREVVKLGTGHWPQFTKPAETAAAIVAAVDR